MALQIDVIMHHKLLPRTQLLLHLDDLNMPLAPTNINKSIVMFNIAQPNFTG